MKRLISLFFTFILTQTTSSQCGKTAIISICDISTIDKDGDGKPDGIINLYEEYTKATGKTISTLGNWKDPERFFVLDGATGDIRTWDLPKSTESVTPVDTEQGYYTFELYNSNCGLQTPALTIQLNIGPFSGFAAIPPVNSEANIQYCYTGGKNLCSPIQYFDLDPVLNSIPSAHKNGQWIYKGNSVNFEEIKDRKFGARVPYIAGGNLVDEEIFEFDYIVDGISPCNPKMVTNVKISIVRTVNSGHAATPWICEDEIINGSYDSDINLTDDNYLFDEDLEGSWSSKNDPTNQITNKGDSFVNIKDVFTNFYTQNPRFEYKSFSYTYSVEDRSLICSSDESTIEFTFIEKIRPFKQKDPKISYCYRDNNLSNIALYNQIEFTTENGVLYDYPKERDVNYWSFKASNTIIQGFLNNNLDWYIDAPLDQATTAYCKKTKPIIDLSFIKNTEAGSYNFKYTVPTEYNLFGNPSLTQSVSYDKTNCNYEETEKCRITEDTSIKITIKPLAYAGEDTSDLKFCETFFKTPVNLVTLLNTDLNMGVISENGTWLNTDTNEVISNLFLINQLTEDKEFNFKYTTNPQNGCEDTAFLNFKVNHIRRAGRNSVHTICKSTSPFNLFSLLDNNVSKSGTWKLPDESISQDNKLTINPNTITTGSYEYVYTTSRNEECPGESCTLTLNIFDAYAGEDTSGIEFCETFFKTPINLTTLLNTDDTERAISEDGTWLNTDTNEIISNPFSIDSLAEDKVFNLMYTTNIENGCRDTAILNFKVNHIKRAGEDLVHTICKSSESLNLFSLLDSTVSKDGTWKLPDASMSKDNELTIDLNTIAAGSYEYVYTTSKNKECLGESATLKLNIINNYAGEDTSGIEFCEVNITEAIELLALLKKAPKKERINTDGIWKNLKNNTVITNLFTIPVITSFKQNFNFTYTTNVNGCEDTSTLSFSVYKETNAGISTTKNICSSSVAFNILDELGNEVSKNGSWALPNGDIIDAPNLIINPLTAKSGNYTYQTPLNGACKAKSSVVTLNITQQPFAGENKEVTACISSKKIDLLDFIEVNADKTGFFKDANNNTLSSSIISLENTIPQTTTYTYIIKEGAICNGDQATITITTEKPETPKTKEIQTFCAVENIPTIDDLAIPAVNNYAWFETPTSLEILPLNTLLRNNEDYYLVAKNEAECYSERVKVIVKFTPLNTNGCNACINTKVSPNGDGINDVLDLCTLPILFPKFELKIYNRYGTTVYTGTQESDLFTGKKLPTGVYFYVFIPNDTINKAIQGDFYLGN